VAPTRAFAAGHALQAQARDQGRGCNGATPATQASVTASRGVQGSFVLAIAQLGDGLGSHRHIANANERCEVQSTMRMHRARRGLY
jgi:hypothetical protein